MPAPPLARLLLKLGPLFLEPAARRARRRAGMRKARLPDGTRVLVRPIDADDAADLARALAELSPASRYQRFLSHVDRLSPEQLDYLTRVDGVNHIALGAAAAPSRWRVPVPIGVARCIRDPADPDLGEVAFTVADAWQGRGVGTLLARHLAHRCRKAGILRWRAVMLGENRGMERVLERVAAPQGHRWEDAGVIERLYVLGPEEDAAARLFGAR